MLAALTKIFDQSFDNIHFKKLQVRDSMSAGFFLFSDTSTVLGKFCGHSGPVPLISTSNHLRVTFHSDNTTTAKGFLLTYSLVSPEDLESASTQVQLGE